MSDLFDTVGAGGNLSAAGPVANAPAAEQKNQVLAEEAAAEPEELPEAEDGTNQTGEAESTVEEDGDNAAASGTASTTTPQPASKPVNVVEEDVYDFDKCLISVAMGMLPDDGNPDGRLVILGVRNHMDEPLFTTCRLNDLAPLPYPIQHLLEQLKEQLPARSEKAAQKKAKAKEEELKRKATKSKPKATEVKAAPQKAEKPKPTSMNLFDMFDKK